MMIKYLFQQRNPRTKTEQLQWMVSGTKLMSDDFEVTVVVIQTGDIKGFRQLLDSNSRSVKKRLHKLAHKSRHICDVYKYFGRLEFCFGYI